MIRLFITHAAEDSEFAAYLIDLLCVALDVRRKDIRCTSVDGHRLSAGDDVKEKLRPEVTVADACIGILSAYSRQSTYVVFELGARWGAGKRLIPLLAPGASIDDWGKPLSDYHISNSRNPTDLHKLIEDLSDILSVESQSPALYQRHLDQILNFVPAVSLASTSPTGSDTLRQQDCDRTTTTSFGSTEGDTEPPRLVAFAIPSPEADVKTGPANVEVQAHLTDNLAGIAGAGYNSSPTQVRFRSPSGQQECTAMFVPEQHLEKGDRLNGHYRSVVTLPRFAEGGVWAVDYFLLVDQCGNFHTLHAAELDARGFPTTITVRS
jgi:hypothetical protein